VASLVHPPFRSNGLGDPVNSRTATPVSRETGVVSVSERPTCVEKLAELFPNASPMRIPVRLSTVGDGRRQLHEQIVIEFGTAHEVLFTSTLPLEFENRVRLVNSDGSFDTQATVVAVRYHGGGKAIAARFVGEVANWIIKI
jgi:hypothetical protein